MPITPILDYNGAMTELQIRMEPDKILRTVCQEVSRIDNETMELVRQMISCMDSQQGVGLAAPQVGLTQQLFVTRAPQEHARVFVNPTILSVSPQEIELQEGCLSIPNSYGMLFRPRDVTVQARDQHGTPFVLQTTGMLARIILHEYDHLQGVLFWDHLSEKKRAQLQTQYRKRRKA